MLSCSISRKTKCLSTSSLFFFVFYLLCMLHGGVTSAGSTGFDKGDSMSDTPPEEINPNRILVKFKSAVLRSQKEQVLQNYGLKLRKTLEYTGVSILNVTTRANSTVEDIVEKLNESGIVEYAEPDYIVKAILTPNDPRFGQLWGLHNTGQFGGTAGADINGPEAWDYATGSTAVVAIMDSGVDYSHEDLAGQYVAKPK